MLTRKPRTVALPLALLFLPAALALLAACSVDEAILTDTGPDAAGDAAQDTAGDSGARDTGSAVDSAQPDVGSPRDGGRITADSGATADGAAGDASADAGPRTVASCFDGVYASAPPFNPDYSASMPTVASHCRGTDHQNITGVQRVVFLGDSVTVGTPPSLPSQFYRNIVADGLVSRFGLSAPNILWKNADLIDGTSGVRESGAFASCAVWGGHTDDLLTPGIQLRDCFPESSRGLRTLVIMTMGGNDLASVTDAGIDGDPIADIWDDVRTFVQEMEDAVVWLKEPGRFPAGIDIVFANMYEFTDGTGSVTSCDAARLAGFTSDWDDPSILADMLSFAEEEYMRIAVETGSDMIFMLEEFCGHGFNHNDSTAPCFRGPGTDIWFDVSCTHPNPTGHRQIAEMFLAVVDE